MGFSKQDIIDYIGNNQIDNAVNVSDQVELNSFQKRLESRVRLIQACNNNQTLKGLLYIEREVNS